MVKSGVLAGASILVLEDTKEFLEAMELELLMIFQFSKSSFS